MPTLRLQAKHKPVLQYYAALNQYSLLHATHEGAVKAAFGTLLQQCAKQFDWTVIGEYELLRQKQHSLRVDAAVVDRWKLPRGYWEAKDVKDDLPLEAKKKIALGYPTTNILFQSPDRGILYQNGKRVLDEPLGEPATLVDILKEFFRYEPPASAEWERAVKDFGAHVPKLSNALLELIQKERLENRKFATAFERFLEVCRTSINPNLATVVVEKMLVQHLLTERIFRTVFDNPDFARRNVIAAEIEIVVDALVGRAFNRQKFLGELDRFYLAIERTARTIDEYSEKQHFLNSVYEGFFQTFDAKVADTHGIVYTPQPIVRFMVRSANELLERELGRSLADPNVHIIDPFVGTGNFLVHVMRQIPKTRLEKKYAEELHANEVMLLPYYVASMNLEHEYAELTGEYRPFEGICLVDTFELAEDSERELEVMSVVNSRRVARQKKSPIFVIVGNPPYNAGQVDDNDKNRNRRYGKVEERIAATYARDSAATLVNSLGDPYVKAFRWATDRLGEEGVLAFVSNSSFVTQRAFDGMRKHLATDFDSIHVLDLGGNVRKNPKLSGTTHNVFGIQVGVAVSLFVRRKRAQDAPRRADIFYARLPEDWRKEQKYKFLDDAGSMNSIEWTRLEPDSRSAWILDGQQADYKEFMPLLEGSKVQSPKSVFQSCTMGIKSNNDAYVYDFDAGRLGERAKAMVAEFSNQQRRWKAAGRPSDIESFLTIDERVLKWIRRTRRALAGDETIRFSVGAIRPVQYRPFVKMHAYLDRAFHEDLYGMLRAFGEGAVNNQAVVVPGAASEKPFAPFATNLVADQKLFGGGTGLQCFPRYWSDGQGRRDNVTDWALSEFRKHYQDLRIAKVDIFDYVYGVLHHAEFRKRYAVDLQQELPRIPYAADFWAFARAGARLLTLHTEYEACPEYPLRRMESAAHKLDWNVRKLRVSKDKGSVVYNEFLTLEGVPPEAFEYMLGNRSSLEWIVDQCQVYTDKRSGITNDPNRSDDREGILRLIGQVVTVSVETMKVVRALPDLGAKAERSADVGEQAVPPPLKGIYKRKEPHPTAEEGASTKPKRRRPASQS